ncbi:hypothetical protein BJV74DRAFT_851928 [Russula compacta]|nr:hypothetical protein BJV74DRAFT_851928 [Russula compacta]
MKNVGSQLTSTSQPGLALHDGITSQVSDKIDDNSFVDADSPCLPMMPNPHVPYGPATTTELSGCYEKHMLTCARWRLHDLDHANGNEGACPPFRLAHFRKAEFRSKSPFFLYSIPPGFLHTSPLMKFGPRSTALFHFMRFGFGTEFISHLCATASINRMSLSRYLAI